MLPCLFSFHEQISFQFPPGCCSPLSEAVPPLALRLKGLREGQCPIPHFPSFSGWGKMLVLYKNSFWNQGQFISVRLQIHLRKRKDRHQLLCIAVWISISYCSGTCHFCCLLSSPGAFNPFQLQLKVWTWVFPNNETQYQTEASWRAHEGSVQTSGWHLI